ALSGSAVALAIGLATAIWAGLGITLAGQRAMDEVWSIPLRRRRNFVTSRLRGLLVLVVVGTLSVAVTTAAGLLAGGHGHRRALRAVGLALSTGLDILLFWAVFRLLTPAAVPTRLLVPGIIAAGIVWVLLQALGGIYVDRVVRRANA